MVAVALATCWCGDMCPQKSALPGCKCRNVVLKDGAPVPHGGPLSNHSSLYTVVECSGPFRTPQDLEENVSKGLHRKSVDELKVSSVPALQEHQLSRLPRGWLRHVRVKQFQVSNSNLSGDFIWFEDPFEGQEIYLRRIGVHLCSLQGALTYDDPGSINTKGLEHLTRLEVVDFSSNRLTVVKASAFSHPPAKLTTLNLALNSLEVVEAGAFEKLARLNALDLSHNRLEKLERKVFAAPAHRLKEINLSWNFLKSLPPDFLSNMPSLRVVKVSKNFLYSMPENPWTAVWRQLTEVDVSGNYIECDCSLLWLLSPGKGNSNSTTTPVPPVAKKVKGQCYANKKPEFYTLRYNIGSLTNRSQIEC